MTSFIAHLILSLIFPQITNITKNKYAFFYHSSYISKQE